MSKSFKPIPILSKKVEDMTVKEAEEHVGNVFSSIVEVLPECRNNLFDVTDIFRVFCRDEKKSKVETETEDPKVKRLKIANEFAMRKVSRQPEKDEDG